MDTNHILLIVIIVEVILVILLCIFAQYRYEEGKKEGFKKGRFEKIQFYIDYQRRLEKQIDNLTLENRLIQLDNREIKRVEREIAITKEWQPKENESFHT